MRATHRVMSRQFLAGALAASLLLAWTGPSAHAWPFGDKTPSPEERSDIGNAPIQRNFLPPVATINGPVELNQSATGDDEDLGALEFSAGDAAKPELNLSNRTERLDNKLAVQDATQLQFLAEQQQALDKDDYNKLWAATVERNPVIQFALEKITTPADLQSSVSSQFYKRLASFVVQGATAGGMMLLPAGDYMRMGTAAGGQAINNIITGANKAQPGAALTDTEKIQLAQLLEELNGSLLTDYHNYKNTLMLLSEIQQPVIEKNNAYSHAIKGGNEVAIMAAATAYYKSAKNQTQLRQEAKLYRMKLERLAGVDAVTNLQLALFSPETNTADANKTAPAADENVIPADNQGNLVKLEPAPEEPAESPVNAAAIVETKGKTTAIPEPDESPAALVGPPEPIGPTLEEMQVPVKNIPEAMEQDVNLNQSVTADDFRRAAEIQTHLPTVETATGRIGIADDGSPSPLPQPIDEAMPILRRQP